MVEEMTTRRKRWTPFQHNRIAADQEWACAHCLRLLPALFHVDHIVPLHQQGTNRRSNLQALCPGCHALKCEDELWEAADTSRDHNVQSIHQQRYDDRGLQFLDLIREHRIMLVFTLLSATISALTSE